LSKVRLIGEVVSEFSKNFGFLLIFTTNDKNFISKFMLIALSNNEFKLFE